MHQTTGYLHFAFPLGTPFRYASIQSMPPINTQIAALLFYL